MWGWIAFGRPTPSVEPLKTLLLAVAGCWILAGSSIAQEMLAAWDLDGYANDPVGPVSISTVTYGTTAAELAPAMLTFGPGASPASAANSGERQLIGGLNGGDVAGAVSAGGWFGFSLRAVEGETFTVAQINVQTRGNGTGAHWVIRSSIDGFSSDLASFSSVDGTQQVAGNTIDGIVNVSEVEFRFYGYGMSPGASVQLRGGGPPAVEVLGYPSGEAPPPPPTQPNVVLVLTDDMGYSDIGAFGSEIETPNLDRLAFGGMRFRRFINHAKCGPTRAAILSGAYSQQVSGDRLGSRISNEMNALGYRTYFVGKNHSGERGYTKRTSMDGGAGNHFNPGVQRPGETEAPARKPGGTSPANNWTIDNEAKDVIGGEYLFPPDFYTTRFFNDKAVEYVNEALAAGQPFFLYLSHPAPHWPLHALAEDKALYEGVYDVGWEEIRARRFAKQKKLGLWPEQAALSPAMPGSRRWADLSDEERERYADRMETHAAMIHRIDVGVGRIIEQLEAAGQLDNTLFVFLSDNGADTKEYNITTRSDGIVDTTSQTSYAHFGQEWANAANSPMRMHKRMLHQGGANTSFFAFWPAGMPDDLEGSITDETGHVIDLLPTFVEAAGGAHPTGIEGRSLLPVLAGEPLQPGDRHDYIGMQYNARLGAIKGDYKLVTTEGRNWGLYYLPDDPAETNDLANDPDHAAVLAELEAAFDAWATREGIGVRGFFQGDYDGGPDQGPAPMPGNGGNIAVQAVDSGHAEVSFAAATDDETGLEYRVFRSYRGDLETVEDVLAWAEPINNWSGNLSADIDFGDRILRGVDIFSYALVRDARTNISVYGPSPGITAPYEDQPPLPGEITMIGAEEPGGALIEWTPASDAEDLPGDLEYSVWRSSSPMGTWNDVLNFGLEVIGFTPGISGAELDRLPPGRTYIAVLVRDSARNVARYPLAPGISESVVELSIGSYASYAEYAAQLAPDGGLEDPTVDSDGDGFTNFEEYLGGTDALFLADYPEPARACRITSPSSGGVLLDYQIDPDLTDVQFRVLASDDLNFEGPDAQLLYDSLSDPALPDAANRLRILDAPASDRFYELRATLVR